MVKNLRTICLSLFFTAVNIGVSLPAEPQSDSGLAHPKAKRLAVMNFDNRSSTGQWQWLSKGLADMIITDLSASEGLMIVERERLNEIVAECKPAIKTIETIVLQFDKK